MAENWKRHKIEAGKIMDMINSRISAIDTHFQYGQKNKDSAVVMAAYAEAKLQIAELKMIFVDLVLEDKQEQLED
jgi:hypothetical protein